MSPACSSGRRTRMCAAAVERTAKDSRRALSTPIGGAAKQGPEGRVATQVGRAELRGAERRSDGDEFAAAASAHSEPALA